MKKTILLLMIGLIASCSKKTDTPTSNEVISQPQPEERVVDIRLGTTRDQLPFIDMGQSIDEGRLDSATYRVPFLLRVYNETAETIQFADPITANAVDPNTQVPGVEQAGVLISNVSCNKGSLAPSASCLMYLVVTPALAADANGNIDFILKLVEGNDPSVPDFVNNNIRFDGKLGTDFGNIIGSLATSDVKFNLDQYNNVSQVKTVRIGNGTSRNLMMSKSFTPAPNVTIVNDGCDGVILRPSGFCSVEVQADYDASQPSSITLPYTATGSYEAQSESIVANIIVNQSVPESGPIFEITSSDPFSSINATTKRVVAIKNLRSTVMPLNNLSVVGDYEQVPGESTCGSSINSLSSCIITLKVPTGYTGSSISSVISVDDPDGGAAISATFTDGSDGVARYDEARFDEAVFQ